MSLPKCPHCGSEFTYELSDTTFGCSECGNELAFEPDVFAKQCPCCGNVQMRTAGGQNPGPVSRRKKAKRGKIIAIIAAICVVVAVAAVLFLPPARFVKRSDCPVHRSGNNRNPPTASGYPARHRSGHCVE